LYHIFASQVTEEFIDLTAWHRLVWRHMVRRWCR